jgi:hypothetical protein
MPPPKSSMTAAAAPSSLWPVVISFECSPLQVCDLPSLLEHRQQKTLAPCYKCGCCSSSRLTPQASQEPPPITPAEQTQPTSAVAHSSRWQKPISDLHQQQEDQDLGLSLTVWKTMDLCTGMISHGPIHHPSPLDKGDSFCKLTQKRPKASLRSMQSEALTKEDHFTWSRRRGKKKAVMEGAWVTLSIMIYLSLRESGIYFNNHNKQVSEFAIEIQKLKRKKKKKS